MVLWRMRWCTLLLLGFFIQGEAAGSKELFKKHLNPTFIETGSCFGEGIDFALEAGFKEVYSVELSPNLYQYCKQHFRNKPQVHLYKGDSTVVLKEILEQIQGRSTFWLDGHYSEEMTAIGKTNSPLLQELELIASHPIKDHTLLIDDVRLFGTVYFDFIELDEIIAAVKKINANYKISLENGKDHSNDVLVAEIK